MCKKNTSSWSVVSKHSLPGSDCMILLFFFFSRVLATLVEPVEVVFQCLFLLCCQRKCSTTSKCHTPNANLPADMSGTEFVLCNEKRCASDLRCNWKNS